MGLFDDYLKKPTSPAQSSGDQSQSGGSGNPGASGQQGSTQVVGSSGIAQGITIQKSEETTIFGPESEKARIAAENTSLPEPTVKAEEANASILVVPTQGAVNMTPSLVTEPSIVATERVQEALGITQAPEASLQTENTLTKNEDSLFSVLGESENTASAAPEVQNATQDNTSTPQEVLQEEVGGDLFAHIADKAPAVIGEAPVTRDTFSPTASQEEGDEALSSPKEFIKKSLEDVALMIGKIDEKRSAKLAEAQNYGQERERYTLLEQTAYDESHTFDDEREHAVRMQKLLQKELANAEAPKAEKTETLPNVIKEHQVHGGGLSKLKNKPSQKKSPEKVEEA